MTSQFDKLARELRDKIYDGLCDTFLVELPAVQKTGYYVESTYLLAFKTPSHPELLPSQPFNVSKRDDYQGMAPWNPTFLKQNELRGPTPNPYSIFTHLLPTHSNAISPTAAKAAAQKYSNLTPVSTVIPYLRTSSKIRDEAAPIIYEDSTFIFPISSPRKVKIGKDAECRMKSIEIHLDLIAAYLQNHSINDEACAFECARRLISRFTNPNIERKTCIISIEYAEHNDFLLEPTFQETLRQLTTFETVVLKLVPSYMSKIYVHLYNDHDYARWPTMFRFENQHNLESVREASEESLGPALEEYERDDFYCLVFQPLSYRKGDRAPEFDIESLTQSYGEPDEFRGRKFKRGKVMSLAERQKEAMNGDKEDLGELDMATLFDSLAGMDE